jgi:hypothetical protein
MGLLDEAIREHLDLKRRRGADPEELERAEREALGPVRRAPDDFEQPEMHAPAQPQPDLAADPGFAYDQEHEEDWEEGFEEEELAPGEAGYDPEPGSHPHEPELTHRAPAADETEEPWAHEPPVGAEDRPIPPPHPAQGSAGGLADPARPASEETVEYEVEFEEERGAEREGEDMLEETPEFLQDTPDHDRLWFEQRPPKDFDFGG